MEYLQRPVGEPETGTSRVEVRPTRWLGWRGRVTPEEGRRNRAGMIDAVSPGDPTERV